MKNLAIILVFLVSATESFGQISFYKQYSNNGYDYGEGIVQTEDSSYIITGQSSSFTEGPAQAFLLKVDSLGNYLWSSHYGGNESDGGKRVMYIENDGILVAGYTNSFGAGAYDFYLFKTDVLGNELWSETYGTESWDRVTDAALTSDSGVIMIGETLNTIDGESDILIVRTDKNGQEVWRRQIGGIGEDVANVIEVLDDSTFAVGGKTYIQDSLKHKALVFRIQDNNTLLWMDTIGPNGNYVINDMSFDLASGNIALVGAVIFPNGDTGLIENKCSINGVLVNENYAQVLSIQYYSGITPIGQNGKYATVIALNNQNSYGGFDLSINQNQNYLGWESGLAGVNYIGDEVLGQLISTNDGGAIAVGLINKIGVGGSNVFLIKVNENGPFFNSNDDLSTFSIVDISEIEKDVALNVFPNPVATELTIQLDDNSNSDVMMFDSYGRLVLDKTFTGKATIPVDSLDNGIYFLEIKNLQSNKSKLVKVAVNH